MSCKASGCPGPVTPLKFAPMKYMHVLHLTCKKTDTKLYTSQVLIIQKEQKILKFDGGNMQQLKHHWNITCAKNKEQN